MSESLHIILFGPPASGKSSILGALAEAGQGQSAQLGGHLLDLGGGLAEVKNRTYAKGPEPTQEELRDYPLVVEALGPRTGEKQTATLTDCSGAAAKAILDARDSLPLDNRLTQALLRADALVLPIDATALERDLPRVGQFLRLFREVRGERADVAGLPVYLVLTKCDAIAKPGDTYNQWVQRIEEGKRKLDQRLQAMLQDQPQSPFGGLNLHLWASAVKRPALADRAAKAEPFGVAELFRQSLGSAREFRQDHEYAAGRLSLTVTGMLGLVAALGLLAAVLVASRPSAELTALENRTQRTLSGASAAERLREPIDERLKELQQIQEHPQYAHLQPKMREDVVATCRELEQYQKYQKEFAAQVTPPRLATRDEELDRIEKALNAFSLPVEYLASWAETKMVRRLEQWRFDIQRLRETATEEIGWINSQIKEAQKLREQGGLVLAKSLSPEQREGWFKAVQEYLDRQPPHKRSERLAVGASLTYDNVYRLQRVEQARKSWESAKNGLKDLRKLAL